MQSRLFASLRPAALSLLLGACSTAPPDGMGGAAPTTSTGTSPAPACIPSTSASAVADSCGVFVSTTGNDAVGTGSKGAPLKTISAALKKGTTIYACAGATAYSETLKLDSAVTLFGGLDCSSWSYNADRKTQLRAAADTIPLTLSASARNTSVYDFGIASADAQRTGGSSIAVVADNVKASFVRCDLSSRKGKDGAAGTAALNPVAQGGAAGNAGGPGCSADLVKGAAAAQTTCLVSGDATGGGQGGDGEASAGGGSGQSGGSFYRFGSDAGVPSNTGDHGDTGSFDWTCAVNGGIGGAGAPGTPGGEGVGALASTFGKLTANGFIAAGGSDGQPGTSGLGGGGGGGAVGGPLCKNAIQPGLGGASGGSGGAGGCGGVAGGGGMGGGASIALVSLNATLTLTDVTLNASDGGNGGSGGNAQRGGPFGVGGAGGVMPVVTSKTGCNGGNGGPGGDGGPGGGGRGGHSIGMAVSGTASLLTAARVTVGASGKGGLGGSNNLKSNSGADGIAEACWDIDSNRGCVD